MQAAAITYLNAYCERAGEPGLLAEPLNALTNLGFIVAAILAARALARAKPSRPLDLWGLAGFLFAIGIGSAAWHLEPSGHTELMDLIPIWLFINLFLPVALRRLLNLPWFAVVGLWAAYFGMDLATQLASPKALFNGSILYVPTLVTLSLLSLAVYRHNRAEGKVFLQVLGVWAASLTLRTVDLAVCKYFPLGTHFLWHLLNAWVLWRLLRVVIASAACGEPRHGGSAIQGVV